MNLGRQHYKMVNGEVNLPHNYISTSNPTIDINPPIINMTWLNLGTGEFWVCLDNATDNNWWVGNNGGKIGGIYSLPLINGSYIENFGYSSYDEIGCWELSGIGAASISDNKYWLDSDSSADEPSIISSTFSISGDFVIEASLYLLGEHPATSLHYCSVRANLLSGASFAAGICLGTSSTNVQQIDSSDNSWDSYGYDHNSVLVRVARSFGEITCLFSHDSGGSWSAWGSTSGKLLINNDNSDVSFDLHLKQEAGAHVTTSISYMKIIQCQELNWGG